MKINFGDRLGDRSGSSSGSRVGKLALSNRGPKSKREHPIKNHKIFIDKDIDKEIDSPFESPKSQELKKMEQDLKNKLNQPQIKPENSSRVTKQFDQNSSNSSREQFINRRMAMTRPSKTLHDLGSLMNSKKKPLRRQGTKNALLAKNETMKKKHQANQPSSDQKRRLDRLEVFKKLYAGQEVQYFEMFDTRGFRGLNCMPFPKHIKEGIE